MMYDDMLDDARTVAWQVTYGGSWSKTHRTNDRGVTTLCGLTVPTDIADSDATSAHGRCKRCVDVDKEKA